MHDSIRGARACLFVAFSYCYLFRQGVGRCAPQLTGARFLLVFWETQGDTCKNSLHRNKCQRLQPRSRYTPSPKHVHGDALNTPLAAALLLPDVGPVGSKLTCRLTADGISSVQLPARRRMPGEAALKCALDGFAPGSVASADNLSSPALVSGVKRSCMALSWHGVVSTSLVVPSGVDGNGRLLIALACSVGPGDMRNKGDCFGVSPPSLCTGDRVGGAEARLNVLPFDSPSGPKADCPPPRDHSAIGVRGTARASPGNGDSGVDGTASCTRTSLEWRLSMYALVTGRRYCEACMDSSCASAG